MKIYRLLYLLPLLFASCNGNHTTRYSVDIKQLKTLPDNSYAYYRGAVYTHKPNGIMIWYDIDDEGNIVKVSKVKDTKNPDAGTTQTIEKFGVDTISEKKAAMRFTELSHKYHFGHVSIDHNNKIAYSTNQDIAEEYIYPLNDSITALYKKDKSYNDLENGWFYLKN